MSLPVCQDDQRCSRCQPLRLGIFCNLPHEAGEHFDKIGRPVAYPGRSVVFEEGQRNNGIYLIQAGQVELFATSTDDHKMILKIARPGDALGLSATLNNLPYEVTAKTLEPGSFKHISRSDFLNFLETHAEASRCAALALAKEHREIFLNARRRALSPSASRRIAQVLIEIARSHMEKEFDRCFTMMLTHDELASLAGTSRETVTRLVNQFERDGIISRDSSIVTILRSSELERLAQ